MNLVRSIFRLFSARMASSLVLFIGVTYFSRVFGPSGIGIFFIFQALVHASSLGIDFGLRGALIKRLSEGESYGEVIGTTLVLKIPLITVFIIVIILFAAKINSYIGEPLAFELIICVILVEAGELAKSILIGDLRPGETASIQIIQRGGWLLSSLVLFKFNFGIQSLVYGLIISWLLAATLGMAKISLTIPKLSKNTSKSLIRYAKFHGISNAGEYAYGWIDTLLIGLFLSQASVGIYDIAWQLSLVITMLSQSIGSAIFPKISELAEKGKISEIENLFSNAIFVALLPGIPAIFGSYVLSEEILRIGYGSGFISGSVVLTILLFEKVMYSLNLAANEVINALDHPDLAMKARLSTIILNIPLNIILIYLIGLPGAAVATAITVGVSTGIQYFYLKSLLTLRFPIYKIGAGIFASIMMFAGIKIIKSGMEVESVIDLSTIIVSAGMIFLLFLLLFSPIRREASNLIIQLRND